MNNKNTLRLRDIMTEHPTCLHAECSAREFAELLESDEISGVPVVDDQDRLIGIVSKTDLTRRFLEGPLGCGPRAGVTEELHLSARERQDWGDEELGRVEDFMSSDVITAKPEESISVAAKRMAEERVHRLVVIDSHQHPIGIVSTLDLLKVYPE